LTRARLEQAFDVSIRGYRWCVLGQLRLAHPLHGARLDLGFLGEPLEEGPDAAVAVGGRRGLPARQLVLQERLKVLALDGGDVSRHAVRLQEGREPIEAVQVRALGGRRQVRGTQVTRKARYVAGHIPPCEN
jgi:hypothetical protein